MATTKTATRTATVAATGNAIAHYAAVLKNWPVKFAGPKPSNADFTNAHALGVRPGTKTAVALAMYMRPDGASQAQVINVNGGPYLNAMRAAIEAGHATRQPVAANASGHTVYKLALPIKGKAANKGKAKGKAAKPRKPAAEKPAADNATA